MNRDDVLRLAEQAGFGRMLTGDDLPSMWHGTDIAMLGRFANLVATYVTINTMPTMVVGNPDIVAVVDAAVMAEREECAALVNKMRNGIGEVSLRASAIRDACDQVERAIMSRKI